ncbi:tetratricopeptide repeat protein [Flavobacterium sp. JP2137]|uniref:tetratricopeptide repeat protein n=1 Tax=Flavobacterium sp. JP2137 TaxID=3414510 RepID=UPI003D2FE8A0
MRKINRLFYWSLSLGSVVASAQQSAVYTGELSDFNHAVALYKEEQYLAAQILFDRIKVAQNNQENELEAACAYYIANCAIRLDQEGAEEKIDLFVKNYPTSSKQNQAYVEVTKFYFDKGDYAKSLRFAQKVKESAMSERDLDRFYFQKGYGSFSVKNKKEAQKYFTKVKDSEVYGEQAVYYLGYIAYDSDNYEDANQLFEQVESKEKYKEKMGYFQADMSFKSGNFQKAIDQGVAQMNKATPEEKSELSKIIGESYFNLGQFDQALPYLLEYKGKKERWSNTDFYQLGYAYYKSKDYEKSIEQFNKIIGGNDGVAQNAYYHLGESYLHTDKKPQALNAFKNASEMSFDAKIQQDAYLNYAKLSYEIGNPYQSVPGVITAFLTKYPASPYKEELESLLIDSYITSKNYKEALVLLERNKSIQNKLAYQKVTFYRGLEFYSDSNYVEALELFNTSIAENQDPKFTARAQYWKGETQFNTQQFAKALEAYNAFSSQAAASTTPEFANIEYSKAYAYFKLKQYDAAAAAFQKFVASPKAEGSRKNDAYVRLGDCNFVLGKYWPAMEAYNKVIESNTADVEYATFQKAMSYGFVDRNDRKIDDLNAFIKKYPKSNFADDALYEIGNTYITTNQAQKGVQALDQLIKSYPTSSFVSRAILRQGLVYYNSNENDKALVKFKKVVADYPNTAEAHEAVSNARLIYVDNGQVEEYANWVKNLDFVEVSNADLENDSYEAAEKQYLQNNTAQATKGFAAYLGSYPNGAHALKSNFYLGEIFYAAKDIASAVPHFEYVAGKARNAFSEPALARLGEIYLSQKEGDKAIGVLKKLETQSDYQQNTLFAQSNLMKVYYEQKNDAQAVIYAEKVLNNAKADSKVKSDAQIIVARAAFNAKDEVKAKAAYVKVAEIAKGELAAEALYFDAYFKNKEGKFEASNAAVQKLAKDYSGYKYFGAKGLVLMAKNFYTLKDSYQATYILESVVKNFTDFPEVVAEAQSELNTIKKEESKRNSSVSK